MIIYVQGLAIADLFGAFSLVAMDHVSGNICFLLDSFDQLGDDCQISLNMSWCRIWFEISSWLSGHFFSLILEIRWLLMGSFSWGHETRTSDAWRNDSMAKWYLNDCRYLGACQGFWWIVGFLRRLLLWLTGIRTLILTEVDESSFFSFVLLFIFLFFFFPEGPSPMYEWMEWWTRSMISIFIVGSWVWWQGFSQSV